MPCVVFLVVVSIVITLWGSVMNRVLVEIVFPFFILVCKSVHMMVEAWVVAVASVPVPTVFIVVIVVTIVRVVNIVRVVATIIIVTIPVIVVAI